MDRYEVVIVGGAAVGSAAAYFLAAHPQFAGELLVLEQDFSYQRCATTLSVASVRHQFSTPENIRMSMFGTEFIARLGEHLTVDGQAPDVGWHEAGYLFLATQAGLPQLQANHRTQRSQGKRWRSGSGSSSCTCAPSSRCVRWLACSCGRPAWVARNR
jgi:FAD-dependent oxidoreductase domain-containing protein 1